MTRLTQDMPDLQATAARIRVVKVGGSLFADPRLPEKFANWLQEQSPAHNFVLTGGGVVANAVRGLDERYQLGNHTAHWLAIEAMRILGRAFYAMMPGVGIIAHWLSDRESLVADQQSVLVGDRPSTASSQTDVGQSQQNSVSIIDPVAFMQMDAASELPLAESWDVTSDTIAARLAFSLNAHELVLLKSASVASSIGIAEWATRGVVDQAFPAEAQPFVAKGGTVSVATLQD